MNTRPVTVVETSVFIASAHRAGMTDEERAQLVDFLARNPEAGDLIRGTGGLRKLRWARSGPGKSGGYRAIYYYHDADVPIYAVLAYGKNSQPDLTAEQRKAAKSLVEEIKTAIRCRRSAESGKAG